MPHRALIPACLVATAVATAAAPAAATTMKTTSGATLASSTGSSGSLKAGTNWHIEGGAGGDIDCTSSTLTGTVGANPNTPSVGGTLAPWSLGGCSETIPFVFLTCARTGQSAMSTSFTYAGASSTWVVSGLKFTFCLSNGGTCTYEPAGSAVATHNSLSTPMNNEYTFPAVPLTETGGGTLCPQNATWTAVYVLVRTSDGAGITIQP